MDKYNGVKTIRMDPNLVWIPDVVLYNRYVSVLRQNMSTSSNELSDCQFVTKPEAVNL